MPMKRRHIEFEIKQKKKKRSKESEEYYRKDGKTPKLMILFLSKSFFRSYEPTRNAIDSMS